MHQLHLKKDNLQFSPLKVEFKKALHHQAQSQNTRKKLQKALYELSSSDEDEFANENPDYGPNLLSANTHTWI
jgi:hypothetical protein